MATSVLDTLPAPDDPFFASTPKKPSLKFSRKEFVIYLVFFTVVFIFEGVFTWFSRFINEILFLFGLLFSVQGIVFLALLVASVPLLILAHEVGHVLGGKLARFRFMFLSVGPLMISKRMGGLKVTVDKNQAVLGGLTSMYPTSTENLSSRIALLVACGPIMSLLVGILLIGLRNQYMLLPEATQPAMNGVVDLYARKGFMILGSLSLFFGVISLIPTKMGALYTDGAHLWMLLRKGPGAARQRAIWLMKSLSIAGQRPRDWPEEALMDASSLEDASPLEFVGRTFSYLHALDRQLYTEAQQQLRRILLLWPTITPSVQPALAMEAAYFEAAILNNAQRGRAWLDKGASGSFLNQADALRSEMAVLLAEGHRDKATALLQPFENALQESIDAGLVIALREWVGNVFARTS